MLNLLTTLLGSDSSGYSLLKRRVTSALYVAAMYGEERGARCVREELVKITGRGGGGGVEKDVLALASFVHSVAMLTVKVHGDVFHTFM